MKLFHILAFSGLLLFSANDSFAQKRTYECNPINPEYQAMADNVVKFAMEDPDAAEKAYTKLTKKIGKSTDDLLSVGTYFLEQNYIQGAMMYSKMLYEKAPEDINVLMYCGEVRMKMQDWGNAGQMFDAVLAYDPNNVEALKRNAFVYKNVNPHVAIDALQKIKELDPTYFKADKDLGDIHYKLDKYKDAVGYYENYYKAVPKDTINLDIRSCENFLQSLYSQANFDRMLEVSKEVLPLAPKDMVLLRMDFFAKVNKMGEALDYDGAVKAATDAAAYIYNNEFADSLYLYLDYEYAAVLEKEKGNIPAAISFYEKALAKDSSKLSGYKELSALYARNKQAALGIKTFNTYLEKLGDKADLSDRFLLATKYMAAYQQEDTPEAEKAEYYQKAGEIFREVIEKKPDYVQAYIFLARLSNVDSSKPLAEVRDIYKKVLEVSEPNKEKFENYRFEACRYIFFYDVSIEPADIEDAKKICEIAKSIRPDDDFVKNAETYLKQMAQ